MNAPRPSQDAVHAPRVLIVEDEPVARMMLEARLRAAGYPVQSARSGEEAMQLLAEGAFAVVVVDLYLEEMSGLDLMVRVRALDPDMEVIILTGGATTASAIAATNHHAYAYLEKPVAPGQIEGCVDGALGRRRLRLDQAFTLRQIRAAIMQVAEPDRPAYNAATAYRVGVIEVDPQRRRVVVGGQGVELTKGEYDLLLYLAQRPDVVHSPELLARDVLGYRCSQDEAREPVKAQIYRLRRKIEADPSAPKYLVSVRGAGYMLTPGA